MAFAGRNFRLKKCTHKKLDCFRCLKLLLFSFASFTFLYFFFQVFFFFKISSLFLQASLQNLSQAHFNASQI